MIDPLEPEAGRGGGGGIMKMTLKTRFEKEYFALDLGLT